MKSKWQDYKNSAEKAQAEGKYPYAETLWYAALEESMDFPDTDRRRALAMERLCECLWYQQKFNDAEPLARDLVVIYTKVFGPDHVDVAAMQANLGLLYLVMKKDEEAEPVIRKALEIKIRILGVKHPDVLHLQSTYQDLFARLKNKGVAPVGLVTARQWKKTGRFDNLAAIPKEAIPAVKKLSFEEAFGFWKPLFEAGSEAFDTGDWQQAEKKFADALQYANFFSNQDQKLSRTLEGLATSLSRQDKYEQAAPLLERTYKIKAEIFGNNHPFTAEAADNLAKCHYYYGNFEAAEKAALECCRIYKTVYGADDLAVATSLGNIATLYHLHKRLAAAEDAYKQCLAIRTKRQGADHEDTIKVLEKYANLLREMHREDEAAHLQACVSGLVTGTWKAITISTEDSLAPIGDDYN